MSVINAMLQKLDQRGAALPSLGPGAATVAPLNLAPSAAPARWRMPLIVALGGVAIAATAFADWPRALSVAATTAVPAPPRPAAMAGGAADLPASAAVAEASVAATSHASAPASAPLVMARASPRAEPSAAAWPASLAPPMPLPSRIDKRGAETAAAQRAAALHRAATELAQAGHARAALER
ncbi:MAG: hypothetical protein Q8L49_14320, partial [Burkholderiaceae bacterium]|nr:hypothetical protein [Burkholderiaceae bacterium]